MSLEVWAPGRVNLIGEHTDYAGGLVLPIAIDLGIRLNVRPAHGIRLSSGGEPVEVTGDGAGEASGWGRYVAAVAQELAALGRPPIGFVGAVEATLPQGAGLGSSGALEVGLSLALCGVAQFELAAFDLIEACRRAERRAVGVPSGILDQAASLLGREGYALLLDCGTLEHRWVRLPPELGIVVVDSGERHDHEGSGYGDRRAELQARHPRRLRHVATENQRVRDAVAALERGDLRLLGELVTASHKSLRDDYEVSTPMLDHVVESAMAAGALGARLTGGGFGGSVVAVAERVRADDVLAGTLQRAGTQGWVVRAAPGATRRRTDSRRDPA
ncbi:MAG TPA: galactokinase family protein [Gaiellaceae bacterium]